MWNNIIIVEVWNFSTDSGGFEPLQTVGQNCIVTPNLNNVLHVCSAHLLYFLMARDTHDGDVANVYWSHEEGTRSLLNSRPRIQWLNSYILTKVFPSKWITIYQVRLVAWQDELQVECMYVSQLAQ